MLSREKSFELTRTAVVIVISLVIAFAIILFVSDKPVSTFAMFVVGPLSKVSYMGNVIEMAIPLIFTGLATAVVFQASLFNLGAEGAFYFSGVIAACIAIFCNLPAGIHALVAIAAAAVVGLVTAFIPGIMKAKWDASELVTSLMFNSIFFGIGLYILNYVLRDPMAMAAVSFKFKDSAILSNIVPGTRIHTGLIIALLTAALTYVFLYKTKWGYALRMTGLNREFADCSGINTFAVIMYAHLIAGAIAGVGGAVQVLGMYNRFEWSALPGYGLDGALVAMLGRNNPIGVVGAAVFLAYLRTGADMISVVSNVPSEMVSVLQAVIILLISAERFLHRYRQRMLLKEVK